MHYLTLDYVKLQNHLKDLGYRLTEKYEKINDITISDIIHFINPTVNALDNKAKNPIYEKSTINALKFIQSNDDYFKKTSIKNLFEQGFISEEENKVEINVDYLLNQLTKDIIENYLITPRYIKDDIDINYNFNHYKYDYYYELTLDDLIKVPLIHHNTIDVIEKVNEIFDNSDVISYEDQYGTPNY